MATFNPQTDNLLFNLFCAQYADPYISIGSISDLTTGGRWFDTRLGQYSFRGLMIVTGTRFIPLITVCCFDTGYVEYCAEYWLKELQESMDRCTCCHDITEILLKTMLNTIQQLLTVKCKINLHVHAV